MDGWAGVHRMWQGGHSAEPVPWLSRIQALSAEAGPDRDATSYLGRSEADLGEPVQCVVVVEMPTREIPRSQVKQLIAQLTREARGVVFTIHDEPDPAKADPGLNKADAPAEVCAEATPLRLTCREREVLERLANGEPAKRIAQQLGISVHTCRDYIKSLHNKLGVRSQVEVVIKAQSLGLLGEQAARR